MSPSRHLAEPEILPFVRPLHDLAEVDPLLALVAVGKLRAVLADAEALAVVRARVQRRTWNEVAGAVGMPMRTTHRHFHHLDPRHK